METKTCTSCQTEKQTTEFHKEKRGRFGVKSICKACHLEKKRNNPKEKEYLYPPLTYLQPEATYEEDGMSVVEVTPQMA